MTKGRRAPEGGWAVGFLRAQGGAAAAEFALVVAVMTVPLANIVDLAIYALRKVQVEMAAQAGVQAIPGLCTPEQTPVTQYCTTGLLSQITTAVQSTSLGADVTVEAGSPVEGYYCADPSTGDLQLVGSAGTIGSPPTRPSDFSCAVVGSPSTSPGDYVQVTATYSFTPLFQNLSVAAMLPSPMARTAWRRVR